jgi:hypothetical protein
MRKNDIEFYQLASHFIFAIILTHAFFTATTLLIPLDGIIENQNKFLNSAALIFSFFIILIGWTGYARSMIHGSTHQDNIFGTHRFFTDILILFLYFYLIEIIRQNIFVTNITFINLLIFASFLIWDLLRIYEFKQKKKYHKMRMKITGFFLGLAILLFVVDFLLFQKNIFDFEMSNKPSEMVGLMLLSLIVIHNFLYRIKKWNPESIYLP